MVGKRAYFSIDILDKLSYRVYTSSALQADYKSGLGRNPEKDRLMAETNKIAEQRRASRFAYLRTLEERQEFDRKDFVFDFRKGPMLSNGIGTTLIPAFLNTFPALRNLGIGAALVTLEPCGVNNPHSHPRATEFLYLIKGKNFKVGFTEEFQTRTIVNKLKSGQGTIFPQGLPHFQINDSCEEAQFFAGLSSEDPGALNYPDSILSFPDNLLSVIFDVPLNKVDKLRAAAVSREIQKECLMKCGLY
ncbi:hypothetical protein NDN08_000285 [Rhodosorus marinus]|uniref:Cupin type-1 domain-containing protein n=1 Tax=Rhodosorus marinus TaxID=101924 RepID=A0AAV8UMG8_9RHOD|nr:hypothetical protein NDN08_000285 [Rhodosorus marinus]